MFGPYRVFWLLVLVMATAAVMPAGLTAQPKKSTILHSELVLPAKENHVYEACLFPLKGGGLAIFYGCNWRFYK